LCIETGILRFGLGRERREPKVEIRHFDEQLKEVGNRKFRTVVDNAKSASFLRADPSKLA
jgi:site-specific DNA-adenine methylase